MAKPTKLDRDKIHHCYYCDGIIESVNDIAWKKFPMQTRAGERWYNRKLHVECLSKYHEEIQDAELKKEENSDWDALYQYVKHEILGEKVTKLDQENHKSHIAKRLLGLRLGQYYPSGNNTRILPRGYGFKTILLAFKVVKPKLLPYLASTEFANHKHKIDGMMRFVVGEVADVQARLEKQKQSNEKLTQEATTTTQTTSHDYTSHLKRKETTKKIKDSVDTGGLL
ncbi:hypothetical protein [Bacillus paranthracis]|uniref:hypothetical protein n=1 Tax=Bacillus paranthracis TaxID=2026186 RepID=UPI00202CFE38|nr:hypothetical protein [Bacillus paranthracis]